MSKRTRAAHLPPHLLLALLVLAGCDRLPWAESEPEAEPARLVVVEPVEVDDALDRVRVLGDLRGRREVRVFSQTPERIRVLHVREGDTVEAGAPIATLQAEMLRTGVAQAEAALTAAEVARDQLRADTERARQLVATGASPRTQLLALEAQLASAEAQVAQLAAGRRSARQQRDRTVVRAPIAGVVANLVVQQGDLAAPSVPLCTVVQMDALEVQLRVTEQDYVRVREGMEVLLVPPSMPQVERRATVRRRAPILDRQTRTALVEIDVEPPPEGAEEVLRPGMVVEASIVLERRPGVILAPARALLLTSRTDTEREANLFVYQDGVAQRRTVRLGPRYGDRVEILGGVADGERVVVQGQHLLRDGAPVRVDAPAEPLAAAEAP
jgi:RND family efflux transporter MFP subunit